MKILITSGGTKIQIDRVRSITNMSRGTFGSKICDAFWKMTPIDAEIVFMHAKDSKTPECLEKIEGFKPVRLVEYKTFNDYYDKIIDLVSHEKFDVICLAAAVSDYGVKEAFNGKYRSTSDEMKIELFKLPKVITEVRKYAMQSTICGFKLLVDSTDDQLRDAMQKQIDDNWLDVCVGNDLRDIKANNHRLTIWSKKTSSFEVYEKATSDLPKVVVEKCLAELN